MGRVTKDGISGAVGPVVFYTVDGKNYVMSKRVKNKKKKGEEMDPVNERFGTVSSYGSKMLGLM